VFLDRQARDGLAIVFAVWDAKKAARKRKACTLHAWLLTIDDWRLAIGDWRLTPIIGSSPFHWHY